MTSTELEEMLNACSEENENLRMMLQSRDEGHTSASGGIDSNPLCKRCYGWRLGVAAAGGLAAATGIWMVLDAHPSVLQEIQSMFGLGSGRETSGIVKAAIAVVVEAIPPLAVTCDWKYRLYKSGYPGLIRAVIDAWQAFKQGKGSK